jgi:hypothetical protein
MPLIFPCREQNGLILCQHWPVIEIFPFNEVKVGEEKDSEEG